MDWTKQRTKKFISIEEAIESLAKGDLDIKDAKEVINATIEKIITQSKIDVKVVSSFRQFMEVVLEDEGNLTAGCMISKNKTD